MKSKQLANVLIKMLGLSVCLYAIPSCVSGVVVGLAHWQDGPGITLIPMIAYPIGAAVQAAVGLVIIVNSQKIAGWMFKREEE